MLMISSRRARKVPSANLASHLVVLCAQNSARRREGSVIMGMKEGTMGFRPDLGIVSFGLDTCGYETDFTML